MQIGHVTPLIIEAMGPQPVVSLSLSPPLPIPNAIHTVLPIHPRSAPRGHLQGRAPPARHTATDHATGIDRPGRRHQVMRAHAYAPYCTLGYIHCTLGVYILDRPSCIQDTRFSPPAVHNLFVSRVSPPAHTSLPRKTE